MTQSIVDPSNNNTQIEHAARFIQITPATDIYENEKELLLVSDLPNVTTESLTLEVSHPDLKIEGRAPGDDRYPERVYTRTFRLDSTLDLSKVEAKLSDGVLKVHLPKSEPYRVRKIQVKGS